MKSKIILAGFATLLMGAWAQADEHENDGPENEATIRLMNLADGGLPEAVTNEIILPEAVPDDAAAADKTANRLATAIKNIAQRDDGIAKALVALEDALKNQETRGRSDNIPDPQPDRGPPSD